MSKLGLTFKRLPTEGAPAGFDPSAGDITYYARGENLAIFYPGIRYPSELMKLGAIETGGAALNRPGWLPARTELVED